MADTETPLLKHWSVSAHRAYRACPRQFWLQYVERVQGVDSSESIRGQVMHAGMAAGWTTWFDQVAYNDEMRGDSPAEDAMIRELERFTKDDEQLRSEVELDECIETVIFALSRLRRRSSDDLIGTELELFGEIDGVPLKVRLDLLFERERILRLYDWKSNKELPRREEVRRNTQLGLGAYLAAEANTGRIKVAIASIGSGVACEVDMPPDMAQAAARRVATTARLAEQDTRFLPVRGEACATCKVRTHCPLFATGPVPEPTP